MAENYEDGLEAVRLLNENPAPPPPVPGEPPPDDCVCHGSRGAGMYVCEHCTYGAAPSAPPQELAGGE